MTCTDTITPAIVDAVYEEALDLTEEARTVFEADDWSPGVGSAGAETVSYTHLTLPTSDLV